MRQESPAPKNKSAVYWGIIMIALGVIFLLDELDIMDAGDFFSRFWPLILIAIGVKMILTRQETSSTASNDREQLADSSDPVKYSKVIGDINLKLETKALEGGNIGTTIGDMKIDLSDIDMATGEKTLSIDGMIGDVRVILPKTLKVTVKANVTIGDIQLLDITGDGFFLSRSYKSQGYDKAQKKLYISISEVIGDIEVRRA
ncbi:MAG: cell wall-active antibiotics response protein LiaF [bacterium]